MKVRNFHSGGSKTIERTFIDPSKLEQDPEMLMLWPTPIYLVKNDDLSGWHATLEESITRANREFRADWFNADFFSLKLDGLEGFCEFLRRNVFKRIAHEIDDIDRYNVTWNWNGWVNALPGDTWHQPHIHERSTLSWVYYIKFDASIDRGKLVAEARKGDTRGGIIQFLDPRGSAPYMACEAVDHVFSSAVRVIPAKGVLIVFPSFLAHFVAPRVSEDPRISIAGNVYNIKAIPR